MARLRYLFDQREPEKERFVYYCSICSCILNVKRNLGPTAEATSSSGPHCLGCGRLLEGNVQCTLASVPEDWTDPQSASTAVVEKKAPLFSPASAFPHFSLGFPGLDTLLRPLSTDRLVVLSGSSSSMVAELAAFRAQLPVEAGGLNSVVLFIDGGNRSDPYLFSSFARQRRQRPATAMRRVATCRIFTLYQLADLISRHLVRAADDYGARLVVIADVLGTFNEPELDEREARRVLNAIEDGIALAKKNALVLATLVAPNKYDETVESWADTLVRLSPSRGRVQADLLRHRNKPPTTSRFKMNQLLRTVN